MNISQILDEFEVDEIRGAFFRKSQGELATPIMLRRTWCQGYPRLNYGKRELGMSAACHRAMWTIFNGDIPEGFVVDHKNGQKSDYRISNLRLVSKEKNNENINPVTQLGARRGAHKYGKKWKSQLCIKGNYFKLGVFDTEEEAIQAYLKAKQIHHLFNPDDYKERGLFVHEIIDLLGGKNVLQEITKCDSETISRWVWRDGVNRHELKPTLLCLEAAGLNVTYSSLYEVSK